MIIGILFLDKLLFSIRTSSKLVNIIVIYINFCCISVAMKEMGTRMSSLLLFLILVVGISCKGDLNDFNTDKPSISPARIAQFYTDQVVQSKKINFNSHLLW